MAQAIGLIHRKLMNGRQPIHAAILMAITQALLTHASVAGELHGQVIDEQTRLPVEGATVAVGDQQTESGGFGFYQFNALEGGTLDLEIRHPAYHPFTESFTMGPDEVTSRMDPLAPLEADDGSRLDFIDVYATVIGVKSGYPLEGVPVCATRFNSMTGANPIDSRIALSGPGGNVTMRGLPAGYYEFRANHPEDAVGPLNHARWEAYPATGKTPRQLLMQSQKLDIALKPVESQLHIRILGLDLLTFQPNQPLGHVEVELTGVIADQASGTTVYREAIPTRTAPTGTDANRGRVQFNKLPNIAYRLVAKRPGYQTIDRIIDPADHGGELPGATADAPLDITLNYIPTSFRVDVEHPFLTPDALQGVLFEMEGLPGTRTEGIRRATRMGWPGSGLDDREFTFLVPGRYRLCPKPLKLAIPFPIPGLENRPDPFPFGEAVVEVAPGHAALQGQQPEVFKFPIDVRPAQVRVRVRWADEDLATSGDVAPKFVPASDLPLLFSEIASPKSYDDLRGTKSIRLDENGEAVFEIDPSEYAVTLPEHPDYWTWIEQVPSRLRNLSRATPSEQDLEVRISHDLLDPVRQQKLRFRSNDIYELDLYLTRPLHAVSGIIDREGLVPYELTRVDPVANVLLTNTATNEVQSAALTEINEFRAGYSFRNVLPGNYNLQLNASERFLQSPARNITIPAPTGGAHFSSDRVVNETARYQERGLSIRYDFFEDRINGNDIRLRGFANISTRIVADYAKEFVKVRGLTPNTNTSAFPEGGFDLFTQFQVGPVWYHYVGRIEAGASGQEVVQIYLDGSDNNAKLGRLPPVPRDVTWKAFVEGDQSQVIEGVQIQIHDPVPSKTEILTTNAQGVAFKGQWNGQMEPFTSATVAGVKHPHWAVSGTEIVLLNPARLAYEVRLKMVRGLRIEGRVEKGNFGNLNGIQVHLLDSSGQPDQSIQTSETGAFEFVRPNDSSPFYLEVQVPGYQRFRKRYSTRLAVPDEAPANPPPNFRPSAALPVTISLQPLPLPTITTTSLDRAGLFLPWVNQQGNQDNLGPATEALTMTWEARAMPAVYPNARDAFPGQMEPETLVDPIVEYWLIDPRTWSGTGLVDADPQPIESLPPLLQADARPEEKAAFLKALKAGDHPNAIHLQSPNERVGEDHLGRGKLPLWTLPPGKFRPLFAVVTAGGAIRFFEHDYGDNEAVDLLEGARLEPWMANLLETTGMFSSLIKVNQALEDQGFGLQATPLSAEFFAPEGRYIPEPDFNVTIARREDDDRFVDYTIELLLQANEGMNSVAGKIMGLTPGFVGLSVTADGTFTIDGMDKAARFTIGSDVAIARDETDEDVARQRKEKPRLGHHRFQRHRYLPKAASGIRSKIPEFRFQRGTGARIETTFANFLRENRKLDWQLSAEVTGGVVGGIDVDLTLLKKSTLISALIDEMLGKHSPNITASLKGAIRARLLSTFSSEVPRAFDGTGSDQVARRHHFGGNEATMLPADAGNPGLAFEGELNLHLGGRATVTAGDWLKGSASLEFRGDAKRYPGNVLLRSATATLNTDADFPFIKEIHGAIGFTLEGELDIYVTKFSGSWEYDVIDFRYPSLNTEPFFSLRPFAVTRSIISQADLPAAEPTDSGLQAVRSLEGPFSFDPGSDRTGVFVDYDPATGEAILKFLQASGESFNDPIEINSRTNHVGEIVTARTDDRWIVAWIEAEPGSGFGPTSVHLAHSLDEGVTWTLPSQLTTSSGVLSNLRLIADKDSSDAALAFLETLGGPLSRKSTILASHFTGERWSEVITVRQRACVQRLEVLRDDADNPTIGFVDELGQFFIEPVMGGPEVMISTNSSGGPLSMGRGTGDDRYAFWLDTDGLLNFATDDGGAGWVSHGELFDIRTATQLQSIYVPNGTFMAAWLGGGGSRQIWVASVDSEGNPAVLPASITRNQRGDYSDIQLTRGETDRDAYLTCRFTNSPGELRVFHLDLTTGKLMDRDTDNDGLADADELHLVDADPEDSIRLIEEVTPDADFDGDGASNSAEFEAGSSPINGLDLPEGTVLPAALKILTFERLGNRTLRLEVQTQPGIAYRLERSEDMLEFTEVETRTADGPTLEWTVEPSPEKRKQYLRVTRR
ncbi:MAG: carboxypeptidase-like regulatory domain-containing protein [Verrucomicrobiota bacterium]